LLTRIIEWIDMKQKSMFECEYFIHFFIM